MKWIKKLFGIESKTEKLRRLLVKYERLAFEAQRKGDMELAGKHKKAAEEIAEQLCNVDISATKTIKK